MKSCSTEGFLGSSGGARSVRRTGTGALWENKVWAGRSRVDGLRARLYRWPPLRLVRLGCDEIARIDREIALYALGCAEIRRLMTILGVSVTTAATLIATIGRIDRFPSARHLVGYIGLDPRSRQSGVSAVRVGHISKQGSSAARHVLCEAAHAAMRAPGPLRAFGQRIRAPRQQHRDRRRRPQAGLPGLAASDHTAGLQLRAARPDISQATAPRAHRRRPKRTNPRGRNAPATPDTAAQWKAEREQALRTEHNYRAGAANWQPQRPAVPT
jgi:hypothetical protein